MDVATPTDPETEAGIPPTVPGPGRLPTTRRARRRRLARSLGFRHRPGSRTWVGGPVPPGADAITLGSLVIVRRRAARSLGLRRHEAVHTVQWRRDGSVRFLATYLGSYAVWRLRGFGHLPAYRRIPAEVEATWRARRAPAVRWTEPPPTRARSRRAIVAGPHLG